MKPTWRGVFPAITTQFHGDCSLNIEGTARHLEAMIQAGIHGVVLLGTVGENTALEYQEKLTVVREMIAVAKGRIPVLTGVAEYTTALGCRSPTIGRSARVSWSSHSAVPRGCEIR